MCQFGFGGCRERRADIEYVLGGWPIPGYLAVPAGEGPWPGVVVVHDAMGMSADLRRITDRFAAHGYVALAPALYRRGWRIGCVVSTFRSLTTGAGGGIDAIVAARDHRSAETRCTGRVFDATAPQLRELATPGCLHCPIPVPWSPATAPAIACCAVRRPGWSPSSARATWTGTSTEFMNQSTFARLSSLNSAGLAYSEPSTSRP